MLLRAFPATLAKHVSTRTERGAQARAGGRAGLSRSCLVRTARACGAVPSGRSRTCGASRRRLGLPRTAPARGTHKERGPCREPGKGVHAMYNGGGGGVTGIHAERPANLPVRASPRSLLCDLRRARVPRVRTASHFGAKTGALAPRALGTACRARADARDPVQPSARSGVLPSCAARRGAVCVCPASLAPGAAAWLMCIPLPLRSRHGRWASTLRPASATTTTCRPTRRSGSSLSPQGLLLAWARRG